MIRPEQLSPVGHFTKPHGIDGELTLVLDDAPLDAGLTPESLRCIIVDIDGILVPFFFKSSRPRGAAAFIVGIDGVDSENDAKTFNGKTVFALRDDFDPATGLDDEDGDTIYLSSLIGFTVSNDADNSTIGTIEAIDDSTDNVLFVISSPRSEAPIYIPAVEEFITDIDTGNRTISVDLPQGLLEI